MMNPAAMMKLMNAKNALVNISKATNAIAKLDELKEEDYTPEPCKDRAKHR